MAGLASWITIKNYKAKSETLKNQITDDYEVKLLKHNQSSNEQEEVLLNFKTDKDIVRSKMDGLEDKSGDEYKDCLAELEELQDAKEDALKLIEEESKRYEDEITQQITDQETQKEAIDADIEGLESARQEDIKNSFSYFTGAKQ